MFYFDNNVLTITRYHRILSLDEKEVIIALKNYSIKVTGQELRLIYLEDIEMKIDGKIDAICLHRINYD